MAQFDLLESAPLPHDLPAKTSEAYRTISEASSELDVPQHVLRFWETHFPQIKPSRIRGRRYYRPDDLELLRKIKILLYAQGYTIKGAKQLVKSKGFSFEEVETGARRPVASAAPAIRQKSEEIPDIKSLVSELRVLRTMLSGLL